MPLIFFTVILPRPQNVTVTNRTNSSVTVAWFPVSHHPVTGSPYNYTVQWAARRGGLLGVESNVTVAVTSYSILGLAPYTAYVIRVAARDRYKVGNFSGPVWVQTLEGSKLNQKLNSLFKLVIIWQNFGLTWYCSRNFRAAMYWQGFFTFSTTWF